MRNEPKKRLAARFIFILTSVILCIFIVLAVFIAYRDAKVAKDRLDDRISRLTSLVQSSLPAALWQYNHDNINEFVDALFLDNNIVFIRILDGSRIIKQNVRSGYTNLSDSFNESKNIITREIKVHYRDELVGVVQIAIIRQLVAQEFFEHSLRSIISLLIALVILSWVIIITVRRLVLTQIVHLSESANAIAEGNLDATIDISSQDEIGALARNFDHMRLSIKESIERIRKTDELAATNHDLKKAINQLEEIKNQHLEERDRAQRYLDIAGVMIVAIDKEQKVTLINREGCKILGYKQEEILGVNWFDTFIPAKVRQHVKGVFSQLVSGTLEAPRYYENIVICKGGKEKIIAWHNTFIKDHQGSIIGTLSSGEDITERKLDEDTIRQQNVVLEAINKVFKETLDCASIAEVAKVCLSVAEEVTNSQFGSLAEVNANGNFNTLALSNPGWEACSFADSDPYNVIQDMEIRGIWGSALKSDNGLLLNNPAIHPDSVGTPKGHPPINSFLGMPFKSKNTVGIVGVANKEGGYSEKDRDIIKFLSFAFVEVIDRKRLEEAIRDYSEHLEKKVNKRSKELKETQSQLIRQEKLAAIGKLAGSVAHDIRNPLGAVSNSVYFLNMIAGKDTDERALKHYVIMEQAINRANDIISDLMDFSRENVQQLLMGNLNSLLKEVVAGFVFSDAITVELQFDERLPLSLFDHSQLQRVFHNLIVNSKQAMPDGGILKVVSILEGGAARVEIADSGYGIDEDDLGKIYEPLFTTKSKGVGLGLSIVKTFLEKHNGTIDVESVVGKGTSFVIRLPLKLNT